MIREQAADIYVSVDLKAVTCGGCGIAFAISSRRYNELLDSHDNFHCPNGCVRHFLGKTEVEKLKEELEVAKQSTKHWIERTRQEEKAKQCIKGQLTKTKNRVQNGVCPCCNRTFQNLLRHMKHMHPNFTKKKHGKNNVRRTRTHRNKA